MCKAKDSHINTQKQPQHSQSKHHAGSAAQLGVGRIMALLREAQATRLTMPWSLQARAMAQSASLLPLAAWFRSSRGQGGSRCAGTLAGTGTRCRRARALKPKP